MSYVANIEVKKTLLVEAPTEIEVDTPGVELFRTEHLTHDGCVAVVIAFANALCEKAGENAESVLDEAKL